MEVKNIDNKIIITIDKTIDKFNYDRCLSKKDMVKYVEFLFDLDYQLNGTDDELGCYEKEDVFEELNKEKNLDELLKIKESIIIDIETYIDYLDDAIPEEYKMGFYGPEPEFINIPTNDTAMYLKMLSQRLKVINILIHRKRDK